MDLVYGFHRIAFVRLPLPSARVDDDRSAPKPFQDRVMRLFAVVDHFSRAGQNAGVRRRLLLARLPEARCFEPALPSVCRRHDAALVPREAAKILPPALRLLGLPNGDVGLVDPDYVGKGDAFLVVPEDEKDLVEPDCAFPSTAQRCFHKASLFM